MIWWNDNDNDNNVHDNDSIDINNDNDKDSNSENLKKYTICNDNNSIVTNNANIFLSNLKDWLLGDLVLVKQSNKLIMWAVHIAGSSSVNTPTAIYDKFEILIYKGELMHLN